MTGRSLVKTTSSALAFVLLVAAVNLQSFRSLDLSLRTSSTTPLHRPPRIAIVSSYVSKDPARPFPEKYLPQLANKACYAKQNNYTFIHNTTWAFPDLRPTNDTSNDSRYRHLDSGTWHCVPHLQAAMESGRYDWVLWTDADYIFQNMSRRIEDLLEPHADNVHVLVPNDIWPHFYFSSWAVLIRNSPFGNRVLHHWNAFAHGLCPKGNFAYRRMDWKTYDQPGLWYALMKTHAEFSGRNFTLDCNPAGYLEVQDPATPLGPEFDHYFGTVVNLTNHATWNVTTLEPIRWSQHDGGLGVNFEAKVGFRRGLDGRTFDPNNQPSFPNAFGLHIKEDLPSHVLKDLETCRQTHDDVADALDHNYASKHSTLQFN